MRTECFQRIYTAIYESNPTNVLNGCTQKMSEFGYLVQDKVNANQAAIGNNTTNITALQSKNSKLTDNGIEVGGKRLIHKGNDRVISIGDNSIKFGNEQLGDQSMWATDENGVVDINITNGSDLLINGRSVQGQIDENSQRINSLGDGVAASTALSSALSALPTAATDAPFSCGLGTGGYSSRFAMGIGCAARLNDRLSFNVGGSHVFGGSSNYGGGSLATVAARAGFVFKLGNIHKPAISNEEQLQSQLDEVKQENKELMARLERLEAIALRGQQPATTATNLK